MTLGTPGTDYPEDKTPIDIQIASRGDLLLSFVEEVDGATFVISVPQDRFKKRVRLDLGEHLELVWKGPGELRARPAELVEILAGSEPRWRLRPVGPASRGQRRNAVRAPLALPVRVSSGQWELIGETIDVSEGGLRCLFHSRSQGAGVPAAAGGAGAGAGGGAGAGAGAGSEEASPTSAPETADGEAAPSSSAGAAGPERGAIVQLTLGLEDAPLSTRAEVIRVGSRGDGRVEMSLRLLDLYERAQDRIRARVFAELRELRSRGLL